MFTAEETELWTNYGSFVGLKQVITAMRVLHVGCSIPARTFGRAEFSQNSRVCSLPCGTSRGLNLWPVKSVNVRFFVIDYLIVLLYDELSC